MIPRHGNYQEFPVTSKKMFDYYYFFIFYFFLDFFEPFFKKFTFSKPSEFMSCGWIFLFLHQSRTLCSNSFSICTHNTQRSVNMIPFLNPVSFFVIHRRVLNMCVRGNAKSNKQETNISRFVWSCSLHRTQTKIIREEKGGKVGRFREAGLSWEPNKKKRTKVLQCKAWSRSRLASGLTDRGAAEMAVAGLFQRSVENAQRYILIHTAR